MSIPPITAAAHRLTWSCCPGAGAIVMDWMLETYSSPEAFLELMDEAGIDYAVILAELAPITSGIAANEDVAQFCSQSPRLIPFASIDPNTAENPADELERWVREAGFKGLKLYPTLNINAEAKRMILGENAARLLKL